jgi:hypothetical protein
MKASGSNPFKHSTDARRPGLGALPSIIRFHLDGSSDGRKLRSGQVTDMYRLRQWTTHPLLT